jgi:hypothetical protein
VTDQVLMERFLGLLADTAPGVELFLGATAALIAEEFGRDFDAAQKLVLAAAREHGLEEQDPPPEHLINRFKSPLGGRVAEAFAGGVRDEAAWDRAGEMVNLGLAYLQRREQPREDGLGGWVA